MISNTYNINKSTAFWLAGSSPAGGTKWNLSSVGRARGF